jgi:predicted SnoaL-like aldol condensation-catalyzing enzyme
VNEIGPTVPRRSPKNAAFSDHQIRQVANGSSEAIARWAEATARERGISVRRMPNDKFVKAASRLSDGAPVNWIAADVVRMQDGSLVEHWDVIQDEATEEQSKSKAPMFGDRFPTS